jgi:tRNA (cytidine56-2'-O)-methyltransferase
MPRIVVLRWGHRPQRDTRLTTHVALTARALGASGIILSDIEDRKLQATIAKVGCQWGGKFFFEMGTPWKKAVTHWRNEGGIVVHLTAYGENIEKSRALENIRNSMKDILVIVGSQKVPPEFFSEDISDFNVAIGNQPHSECASLAIFLYRLSEGKALARTFQDAKIRIIPQKRGKKIIRNRRSLSKDG